MNLWMERSRSEIGGRMRNNLDAMAKKANERGMTYGQLQAQETLRKMNEDKERDERIRRAYDRINKQRREKR